MNWILYQKFGIISAPPFWPHASSPHHTPMAFPSLFHEISRANQKHLEKYKARLFHIKK